MTFPLCPRCHTETRPCHKRFHEIWVDDGYKCQAAQGGCGRHWTSGQLEGFERDGADVDTQATKYVKAHARRQRRAARLAGQIPVVEETT